jgi:hypothetical protein
MQLCSNHTTPPVNQQAAIEEEVFFVGAVPRLYNEDLMQLEGEFSQLPELAVAAEN